MAHPGGRPRKTLLWTQLLLAYMEMRFLPDNEKTLPMILKHINQQKEYEAAKKIINHPEFRKMRAIAETLHTTTLKSLQTKLQDKPDYQTLAATFNTFLGIDFSPPELRTAHKVQVSGNITFSPQKAQAIGSLTPAQRHRMIAELEQANMAAMQEYQALSEPCIDAEYTEIQPEQ